MYADSSKPYENEKTHSAYKKKLERQKETTKCSAEWYGSNQKIAAPKMDTPRDACKNLHPLKFAKRSKPYNIRKTKVFF